jgi:Phosphodiester glycosidase
MLRVFLQVSSFAFCAGALIAFARTTWANDRPVVEHELLRIPTSTHPARIHRFRMPLAQLHVEVVDLAFTTPLGNALGNGDLIVNGGFWEWHKMERRAMGLLASGGKVLSPLRAALDGGVLLVGSGRARIVPSRAFSEPLTVDLALQCRPRLLQAGKLIPELNAHGRAARTAVCVREAGRTLDVYLSEPDDLGPSLQDLGTWLLGQGCEHALNLDGGPSTAAAFRDHGKVVKIGPGVELPYGVRFTYAALQGSSGRSATSYAQAEHTTPY